MRASKLGYRHMITPDAQIMHLGGASATHRDTRVVQVMRSKASLIRDHWERPMVPIGIGLLWLW
ncbi:MAG: glycosyltransferase family 2 protein, partial [Alteraurantiacibacter sp. bin_em_oilr2.035]|nr:glycosyltransferase family 2 protein [Alteraurantiacibacter sp. bin_em_oilr2.035]